MNTETGSAPQRGDYDRKGIGQSESNIGRASPLSHHVEIVELERSGTRLIDPGRPNPGGSHDRREPCFGLRLKCRQDPAIGRGGMKQRRRHNTALESSEHVRRKLSSDTNIHTISVARSNLQRGPGVRRRSALKWVSICQCRLPFAAPRSSTSSTTERSRSTGAVSPNRSVPLSVWTTNSMCGSSAWRLSTSVASPSSRPIRSFN